MAESGKRRGRQAVVAGTVLVGLVAAWIWTPLGSASRQGGATGQPSSMIETRADALVEAPHAAPGIGVASAEAASVKGASASVIAPRPIVAPGRTVLSDVAVAVRSGDTVAVHFDTPETRTRRPEKFERIVRSTLPAVYGPAADSALAAVPEGMLASGGDLLTALPERGVRLPTADGGALMLWPETRPGRDGPLVVTYRATIVP